MGPTWRSQYSQGSWGFDTRVSRRSYAGPALGTKRRRWRGAARVHPATSASMHSRRAPNLTAALSWELAWYISAAIKMRRAGRQLELTVRTWGGRRRGAGRKPRPGRRSAPHHRRDAHVPRHPTHVTLRARWGLPSLRADGLFAAVSRALGAASRDGFRLLHFSVQSDHLHLLVVGMTEGADLRRAAEDKFRELQK